MKGGTVEGEGLRLGVGKEVVVLLRVEVTGFWGVTQHLASKGAHEVTLQTLMKPVVKAAWRIDDLQKAIC